MGSGSEQMDIAELVARHHAAVYRYAYRLTGSVADAEDLTQDVFLAAHRKLPQLRNPQSARSWLFVILRNQFIKTCRKRTPSPETSLQLNLQLFPQPIEGGREIDQERLRRALGQLPEPYRLVVLMFYFEGASYREIAERLDIALGTVMSRLARAKRRLREQLCRGQCFLEPVNQGR